MVARFGTRAKPAAILVRGSIKGAIRLLRVAAGQQTGDACDAAAGSRALW